MERRMRNKRSGVSRFSFPIEVVNRDMSLSESLTTSRSPDPPPGGVLARSRSFVGLMSHRRTASSTPAFSGSMTDGSSSLGSSSGSSSNGTVSKGSVLGQHHSPHASRRIIQGLSATWSGKPPRSPRPARTLLICHAIERGLRECIGIAQEDILNLRSSMDNLSLSSSQQLKTAERYLKRLEFQLSKVEELREQYEVQQRMREGVRSMAYAYVLSPGDEKDTALHGVRSGYRECMDSLCLLEAHLEQLMGTLQFQMRGIQGFARLCAGDNFEITVKHGEQKWKSRGRVQKNGQQVWDNQQVLVKALLGEFLYIKAVEVRGLGKNVLLGNKSCEIKDLFSSHSQLMTVNLNSSGSLKLNLVITWNPLHGCMEDTHASKQTTPILAVPKSPFSKRRGVSPFRGDSTERSGSLPCYDNGLPQQWQHNSVGTHAGRDLRTTVELEGHRFHCYQGSNGGSVSAPSSAATSPNGELPRIAGQTVLLNAYVYGRTHSPTLQPIETTVSHRWSGTADSGSECCSSVDTADGSSSSLQQSVRGLHAGLEDIQGQYPELHSLEQSIAELDRILRKHQRVRRGSTGSAASISVESALGCFDFLNSAIEGEDSDVSEASPRHRPQKNGVPDSHTTTGTADSGLSSLVGRRGSPSSVTSSPVPVTTGSEHLDLALSTHCWYCHRLLETLGSFGPLHCRERHALEKLRRQSKVIEKYLQLAKQISDDKKPLCGSKLIKDSKTRWIWEQLVGPDAIVSTVSQIRENLTRLVRSCLNHASFSDRVTAIVLFSMLDVPKLEPNLVVTALQFESYLMGLGEVFEDHVATLEDELKVLDALSSKEVPTVKRALSQLRNSLPSKETFFAVMQMLVCGDPQLVSQAEQHLKMVTAKSAGRKQACNILLEGLEADAAVTRQGCCRALSLIQAQEFMEQLVHLSYADESPKVRQEAKDALFSFGESGRKEYKQSQLVTHGFQGRSVK
ncbi:rho family-interacting cell polarization regulator 2-like isoform X2 [Ornithodoros turicata]|uniref:rho family-interacting cell polarization regulator 2-like isoform X2 n=1 Tax=Ornithodoros turicata TaxID=34597 RepID=UPI003139DC35